MSKDERYVPKAYEDTISVKEAIRTLRPLGWTAEDVIGATESGAINGKVIKGIPKIFAMSLLEYIFSETRTRK